MYMQLKQSILNEITILSQQGLYGFNSDDNQRYICIK